MKTFEEAMRAREVKSPAEADAVGAEVIGRFQSIITEIGNSETAKQFICDASQMPMPEGISDEDATFSVLMSVFINGVMIGIEMEKSE